MVNVKHNKTIHLIPRLLFSVLIIYVSSTYACINQDGTVPSFRSVPTDKSQLPPSDIRLFGENTLVILVDFTGCAGTTTQAQWNTILYTLNTPGTSMRDYYREVSGNYFGMDMVPALDTSPPNDNGVVGWYHMPFSHPCNTYGTGWANLTGESLPGMPPGCRAWALSKQLAYLAIRAADVHVDYGQFYHTHYNPWEAGYMFAHIIIVVAGYEGTYNGAPQPYVKRHHWFMPGMGYIFQYDDGGMNPTHCIGGDVHGYGYILVGEKTPSNGIIGQGLVAHEVGHSIGLPDLYDVDGYTNGYGNGLGSWCLMAGGDWSGSPAATKPSHLSAWCKIDREWIAPTVVQNSNLSNIQIPAVESIPAVYKLIPYNRPNCRQYFLVENRQLKKFDGALPGAGLIIYHVDDSLIGLYRGSNSINTRVGYTDAMHYGVDAECQDGYPLGSFRDHLDNYDTGNWGDANDPWDGSPDFDTTTTPNSSVYYGSKSSVKSYVAVKNISMSGGIVTADLGTSPPSVIASESEAISSVLPLLDVTPNPFTKLTTIRYTVPISGKVLIKLYNATGRLIETLIDEHQNSGSYTLIIDNCKLKIPNGVYFLKYESNTNKSEVKLIVQ